MRVAGSDGQRACLWRQGLKALRAPDWRRPHAALMLFGLSADHCVRFPDGTTLVGRSFQSFIGNFRPQLLQWWRCRLVRVPFSVIRIPWHVQSFIKDAIPIICAQEW